MCTVLFQPVALWVNRFMGQDRCWMYKQFTLFLKRNATFWMLPFFWRRVYTSESGVICRFPMIQDHMTLTLGPRKNPRRKVAFLLRLSVSLLGLYRTAQPVTKVKAKCNHWINLESSQPSVAKEHVTYSLSISSIRSLNGRLLSWYSIF